MNSPAYEVKPQYSFTVEQSDDTYSFTYKRAKYSVAMYIMLTFMIFILTLIFTSIFMRDFTDCLLIAIILPVAICILISRGRGKAGFRYRPLVSWLMVNHTTVAISMGYISTRRISTITMLKSAVASKAWGMAFAAR